MAENADISRYIPWRKRDIVEMLIKEAGSSDNFSRVDFKNLCEMLENILHFEFRKDLETLKDVYFPVNPDLSTLEDYSEEEISKSDEILLATLRKVLNDANYDKVSREQIQEAYSSSALTGVTVKVDEEDYRFVEIYARGSRMDRIRRSSFFGLIKKDLDHKILERVLIIAKMKDGTVSPIPRGKTIIKLFKDVPLEDLELLYPDSRVIMSLRDKLFLAVPAVAGGIPLLISKVVPALIVVFLVISAWFGYKGTLEENQLKQAVAALSALGALGGYLFKQFSKYKTRKIQFQKELSDNLYFRNLVNNAGVFYSLIDSAEEEEFKEAILAYFFISRSEKPLSMDELDRSVERWFLEVHRHKLDFECPDALDKLRRFGLLAGTDESGLNVLPYEKALENLDNRWDNYFTYNK